MHWFILSSMKHANLFTFRTDATQENVDIGGLLIVIPHTCFIITLTFIGIISDYLQNKRILDISQVLGVSQVTHRMGYQHFKLTICK